MYNRNGRVAFSVLSLTSLTVALALIAPPAAAFTAVPDSVGVGLGPEGMALDVGPGLVVANAGGDSLSLVDTSTTPMVVTSYFIPGLSQPVAVVSRPSFGDYLVVNRLSPSVAVVSAWGGVVRTYPLPPTAIPSQILVAPYDPNVWFVLDRTGAVIRIDESLGLPGFVDVFPFPVPLSTAQFSANGTHLYVASQWGELMDVDPRTMSVTRSFSVNGNVSGLAVQGRWAYLSAGATGVIFRVNLTTGQVREWAVGGEPGPMSLAWFGRYLFVADRTDWALDVVKTRNGQVVNSFPLPARPHDLVLSSWNEAFVSHTLTDSVTRLRIDPDPPTPPQGWVDKRCTRSSGQVTVDLRWRRPSSQGDLPVVGYRFRAQLRNGSWTAWAYTVRTETNGSMSVPGYRPGERIPLQVQALTQVSGSAALGGQCTVTR